MAIQIVQCPLCETQVGIASNGVCPSCQEQISPDLSASVVGQSSVNDNTIQRKELIVTAFPNNDSAGLSNPKSPSKQFDGNRRNPTQIWDASHSHNSFLLGRLSIFASFAAIFIPIGLIMCGLGPFAGFYVSLALTGLALLLGVLSIYPIWKSKKSRLRRCFSICFIFGLVLLPCLECKAINEALNSACELRMSHNMRAFGLAFDEFVDTNRYYPADIVDKSGNPILSWRVAILPFIGEHELYRKFHLNEPWDSENNRQLLKEMPEVFKRPRVKLETGHTVIQRLIGEYTPFPAGHSRVRTSELQTPVSETVMLLEGQGNQAVPWTKPQDLTIDQANPKNGGSISTRGGRVQVLRIFGNVTALNSEELALELEKIRKVQRVTPEIVMLLEGQEIQAVEQTKPQDPTIEQINPMEDGSISTPGGRAQVLSIIGYVSSEDLALELAKIRKAQRATPEIEVLK